MHGPEADGECRAYWKTWPAAQDKAVADGTVVVIDLFASVGNVFLAIYAVIKVGPYALRSAPILTSFPHSHAVRSVVYVSRGDPSCCICLRHRPMLAMHVVGCAFLRGCRTRLWMRVITEGLERKNGSGVCCGYARFRKIVLEQCCRAKARKISSQTTLLLGGHANQQADQNCHPQRTGSGYHATKHDEFVRVWLCRAPPKNLKQLVHCFLNLQRQMCTPHGGSYRYSKRPSEGSTARKYARDTVPDAARKLSSKHHTLSSV